MNTIKLAYRTIVKNRNYTLINILGLTLGISLILTVFAVVFEEHSYNRSFKNADRLYRINTVDNTAGIEGKTPSAFVNLSLELQKQFPEVEISSSIYFDNIFLSLDGKESNDLQVHSLVIQPNALEMLDIEVLQGNPREIIAGKTNILIDEDFKKTHFQNQNVLGKVIRSVDPFANKTYEYIITGIIKKLPYNSTFRSPVITMTEVLEEQLDPTGAGYFQQQFLQLRKGTDVNTFQRKVNRWYQDFLDHKSTSKLSFEMQPIWDIYMNTNSSYTVISGNPKASIIFQAVALLVLIISCINFINIYTIRSIDKIKALNIHKVLGASRTQLIRRLLLETCIIFLCSAILSFCIFLVSLNPLEGFLGFELVYIRNHLIFTALVTILGSLILSLLVGLYPSFMISNINFGEAMRNKLSKTPKLEVFVKKGLLTIQFCIAFIVTIELITIHTQVSMMDSKPTGINANNLLNIKQFNTAKNGENFRDQVTQLTGVKSASLAAWTPNLGSGYMKKNVEDPNNASQKIQVSFIAGDPNLSTLLDFKLLKGRFLRTTDLLPVNTLKENKGDTEAIKYALITETTAKKLNIQRLGEMHPKLGIIPVGLIKDFHSESFHNSIVPTVIVAGRLEVYANLLIKVEKGHEKEVGRGVEKIAAKIFPNKMLEYQWIDDLIRSQYQKEKRMNLLFTVFSILTLMISALGITGIIMQSIEQRIKEIGVRKVLGASIIHISSLFSKLYVQLIIISVVLGSPIAWYFSNKWLEDFAYRIHIEWWFFLVSGLILAIVTLITVNLQTVKAAIKNPVKNLKE